MSCEDIAYELIRDVFLRGPWKLARLEYFPEIAVSFDKLRALNLKISFRELRLKKHIAELHINFGSLNRFGQ